MKKFILATTTLLAFTTAMPAFATGDNYCGNADTSTWMSVDALKMKAIEMGYDVKKVEIDDGCYEIYAIKDGKRVEAYLNPVSGDVVRVKSDD